ncbi:histidine phosphatase family protein [Ruania albidiflava]|uniref:histidine phosphatase family protein n=1 Tax=Ruania albidiflava TaxID=366586 RepID=UPI0003B7383E|nr:histidine phosphatase family protein [Ruania albidiflava]
MSDLQCAARFLVVRHAEAAYPDPDPVGGADLGLTEAGRSQARSLGQRVAGERVAAVLASKMGRAAETAQIVAAELGCTAEELDGVQEYAIGDLAGSQDPAAVAAVFQSWVAGDLAASFPGGESGRELVARFRAAIEDVADSYRGETVLVVSHGGVMSVAIPRLTGRATPELLAAHWVPHCGTARVDVDADGWLLHSWPGSADPAAAGGAVDNSAD